MADLKKAAQAFAPVAGLIGAAGGWALSQYAGTALWVPALATVLLGILFTRSSLHPRFFRAAIAIIGGHVICFIYASLGMHDWTQVGPDIVVLSALVAWLWLRPNLAAVLILGGVEVLSLAYNLSRLASFSFGSFEHKTLTVHGLWRVASIISLVTGYMRLRRVEFAGASPPPLPTTRS